MGDHICYRIQYGFKKKKKNRKDFLESLQLQKLLVENSYVELVYE